MRTAKWAVREVESLRFGYLIGDPTDGRLLIDAFYLPEGTAQQLTAASELVAGWSGAELGIRLRRFVATPLPP